MMGKKGWSLIIKLKLKMFGEKSMEKVLMLRKSFPSYIRGTIDFLRRLNSSLPNNSVVSYMDIETLYQETWKFPNQNKPTR